jgi:hypothetical protein
MANIVNINEDIFLTAIEKDTFEEYAAKWKEVHNQIKELQEKEKLYKNYLIDLVDGDYREEAGIKLLRSFRVGSVDYSKVEELKGVDLNKYRKDGSYYWTIKPSTKE